MSAIIAIVGRPNVGKSTLFNRLAGASKAIVDDQPGVTRDRNYALVKMGDRTITLVDTGGFESGSEGMMAQVREQTLLALEEADLTVFLVDGRLGRSPHDEELVQILRRSGRPFVVAANKIDGPEHEQAIMDFYALGVEEILPLSAAHGYGIRDFVDRLLDLIPETGETAPPEDLVRVAIIGRPNVGKSSMLNKLIGQDRSLVNDVPGTTRDPVDVEIERNGRHYCFVDTPVSAARARFP